MRRFSIKSVLALGVATLSLGALPSCATNDSMMFIVGVQLRKSGACEVKPETDSALLASGTLDRLLSSEYQAALLIGNQVTQRGARERLRTETSNIALKGAEVKLETLQGASLAPPFSASGNGFVYAAEGTDAGMADMFVSLIPASVSPNLPPGTLVAKVRAFGTTLGGEDIESNELTFTIRVCDGCLISYPAEARDLTADGSAYQCKLASDDTTMSAQSEDTVLPCAAGVDFAVPCTSCSGFLDACRSPENNPFYTP